MTLPLVGILWIGRRRAKGAALEKYRRTIAMIVILFGVLICASCGGGLQGGGGGSGSPGTLPGRYTITITASSGAVTHGTPVTLVVTP